MDQKDMSENYYPKEICNSFTLISDNRDFIYLLIYFLSGLQVHGI